MTTPKTLLLGAVLVSLLADSTALARAPQPQSMGKLPERIVTANEGLTAADLEALAKFVDELVNIVETSRTPGALEDARRDLVEPFRSGLAKAGFRNAYSNAAVKRLKPVIEGSDVQRAIVAMQVAAFIGTKDSLSLIVSRLDASERDVAKRQNAASTIGHAMEMIAGSNAPPQESGARLNDVDIDTFTRTITSAAEKEPEVSVVLQELRALSIIAGRPGIGAKSAALARERHVQVVEAVLARVEASKTPDVRIQIVTAAVADFQRQWTRNTASHSTVGPVIAPLLAKVLKTSGAQWDAAHGSGSAVGDDAVMRDYADAVAGAEVLLRVIDSRLRSGAAPVTAEGEIKKAWDSNDRAAFDAAVAKWIKIVGEKPYAK